MYKLGIGYSWGAKKLSNILVFFSQLKKMCSPLKSHSPEMFGMSLRYQALTKQDSRVLVSCATVFLKQNRGQRNNVYIKYLYLYMYIFVINLDLQQ